MGKKVVILQHRLLHYREGFFEELRAKCGTKSINLHLVHGQASPKEKERKDEGFLGWADKVKNFYLQVGGRDLLWQPFPKNYADADLIVMMQENRIVSNYLLIFFKKRFAGKLAYWGHGANFQSDNPGNLREKWKSHLINKVDWWFAYTQASVDVLLKAGFSNQKIANLNNAVDTHKFIEDYNSVTDSEVAELKDKLGIPLESKVGVFCGTLYKDKKLDLLLSASDIVREAIDFHLIIIGAGDEFEKIAKYAERNTWVHLVGVQKGYDKAWFYKASDIMLNPGLLGLHILDSFSVGIPLISTLNAMHSPEISYIKNGENAILTDDTPDSYAIEILKLITDQTYFNYIRENALKSGEIYTLDNMVNNFFDGIINALER